MLDHPLLRKAVLALWVFSVAGVVYLSLLPGVELPVNFWNSDKVGHFLAYGWLGALPLLAFARRDLARTVAYAMIPLGGLVEWGQSFVPGRTASMGDAVANALGVFLGIWLVDVMAERIRRRRGLQA